MGNLHEGQCTYLITLRSFLLTIRNTLDKACRENQNTHFMFNNVFRKSCRLSDNVEKYCTAGQAADDNMAHANFMLDN